MTIFTLVILSTMGLLIEIIKSPASQQSSIYSPLSQNQRGLKREEVGIIYGKSAAGRVQESIFINFIIPLLSNHYI